MALGSANATGKWGERPALEARVAQVLDRVAEACVRAGRPASAVRVVAVAKFHPAEAVQAVVDAGLRDIGENRVQEAAQKATQVRSAVWHMVGRLQGNKAARAAGLFDWVHSLDRRDLVPLLESGAARRGTPLQVLVQVNLAGEPQKAGCLPEEAQDLLMEVASRPMLAARGLMTIPPAGGDPGPYFAALRELLQRLQAQGAPSGFDQLSMGMSGDFAQAIAEGATMVRIGTMIFGPRGG